MDWIRKTVIFVSLLIMAFFAVQANQVTVQKIESEKSDTNFSNDYVDASDFIQPQASYQFTANIKTIQPILVKWFDSLLITIPAHQVVKSKSNFANQLLNQSRKISLLLYPFHYFW
ncbi:hypothetical protein [Flavobacterium sp. N1736]|uniref:hypothetical protein n=1 Tax=Flavobacterium sp. N1736 TaxID=2986823 RepID=UPI0022251CF2|nr:hypothetical protein [Flavobacterium sp. N1736]